MVMQNTVSIGLSPYVFPVDCTLLEMVVSSTMADTLRMSFFVVKIVIPPDRVESEEYRENLLGDKDSLLFLFLVPFPLPVRLRSSVSKKFT